MLEHRQIRQPDGEVLVWNLLEAEQSEAVLNLLKERYTGKEGSQLVMLSVEATLLRAILQNLIPLLSALFLFNNQFVEIFSLRGSGLPNDGVSAAMEYCQDNDAMFLWAKINAVWKTIGDYTPNVLTNNGKLEGVFRCQ